VSTMKKGNFFSFFRYWKIATKEYKYLVTGFLLFALFNSSDVFLLLKTKEIIGDDTIKIFGGTFNSDTITIAAFIFYNLVWSLGSYPLGILADKIGFKKIFLSVLILFAIVYAGFAFDPSITTIFILFFIYGLFAAATDGISKAWITNTAHGKNTATAIGFYTSCESICALGASAIAGLIWDQFGSSYTFISTAAMAIIVFVFLLLRLAKK
jgi:MFS family permease